MGAIPIKYDVVQEKIRTRILSGELTGTLPGVKQLALEYDVNFMTVNKAINHLEKENLVYRIPRKGTYVRQQKNILFAFHDPSENFIESPFFAPVIAGIQKILAEFNCFMIYENLYGKPEYVLTSLAKRIDGMIMIVGNEFRRPKVFYEKPCVRVLGEPKPEFPFDHISYNNNIIGKMAAEHLLKLGHEKFAYLGYNHFTIFKTRCETFEAAIRKAGKQCIVYRDVPERYSQDFILEQLNCFMLEKERPTGIFCSTDDEACVASTFFYENGLRPGHDVQLISCNNDPMTRMFLPSARPATFELCRKEIAMEAARLLIQRINGFSGEPVIKLFTPKLIQ